MHNIFAEELSTMMVQHGRQLGGMHGMRLDYDEIHPQKITLMIRSLGDDSTAVLSARELDILRTRLPLSDGELRRLKAAIFGEAIRFTVWSRAKKDAERQGKDVSDSTRQTAYRLGRLTFDLLMGLQGDAAAQAIGEMLEKLRGSFSLPVSTGDMVDGAATASQDSIAIDTALALATDRYTQGSLWVETARDIPDRAQRQAVAAQAHDLLNRAKALALDAPDVAQGTDQQRDLIRFIDQALADIQTLW